ncbi:MAG TPA: type VI secretion system protein TssA [Phycisphaerae bacterium]|nr:type VI secretion system protein TssA [Phycisphaerae bacterium]
MAAIEVEPLLAPVSAEAPAGSDLEFDPGYFALEKLAQGTPESVMGEEVKPAEEPEFPEVKKAALELFTKTRDLRVAMILTAALLKTDGLAGFKDGVSLVKGFVETLWEEFYPKLDPTDNNDPTIRVNLLKGFDGDGSAADLYKFKQRLREAVLTNSQQRIGAFSYRDIQVAKGEVPPPAAKEGEQAPTPPDMALINAAFEDTPTESLADTQNALTDILAGLEAIDAGVTAKTGPGIGPDMTGIKEVVSQLKGVIDEQLAKRGIGEAPAAATEAGGADGGGGAPAGGSGVPFTGDITSRNDVLRVLDQICDYYERYEPSSPVPIFMKRAKQLVPMGFAELIQNLAPEAMPKIDIYTGAAAAPPA